MTPSQNTALFQSRAKNVYWKMAICFFSLPAHFPHTPANFRKEKVLKFMESTVKFPEKKRWETFATFHGKNAFTWPVLSFCEVEGGGIRYPKTEYAAGFVLLRG